MDRRSVLVYIAGPFRAPTAWEIEQNIRAAEELALEVWRAGFTCICPHLNTRHFQGALPDAAWLNGDLIILGRCDALLALPKFGQSEGAKAEIRFALFRHIPVSYGLTTLMDYYSTAVGGFKNRDI